LVGTGAFAKGVPQQIVSRSRISFTLESPPRPLDDGFFLWHGFPFYRVSTNAPWSSVPSPLPAATQVSKDWFQSQLESLRDSGESGPGSFPQVLRPPLNLHPGAGAISFEGFPYSFSLFPAWRWRLLSIFFSRGLFFTRILLISSFKQGKFSLLPPPASF